MYPNWPHQIAPFQVIIIPPKAGSKEEELGRKCVEKLINEFSNQHTFRDDVMIDDRTKMSIGSRLVDAKLVGAPYIVVVGKSINENKVEIIISSTTKDKNNNIICSINDVLKTINELNDIYFKTKNNI